MLSVATMEISLEVLLKKTKFESPYYPGILLIGIYIQKIPTHSSLLWQYSQWSSYGRQRLEGLFEFKASLVDIVSYRPVRAI